MNRVGLGLLISAIVHAGVMVYGFAPETVDPTFNVQTGRSSVDMVFSSAARASSSPEKKQEKSETKTEEKTNEKKQKNDEEKTKKPEKRKSQNPEKTQPEKPVEKVVKPSQADTATESKQSKTSSSKQKKETSEQKQSRQSAPQAVKHAGVKWVQDADYRRNPPPRYPTRARVRHQEGAVKLLVKINQKGYPEKISVRDSSGYHLLDRAAKRAVQRWEFVPAEKNGEPIASMTVVPVQFSLDR